MTALVRVRVVPDSGEPLDLALPGRIPVADLLPELVRLARVSVAARLVTATGRQLEPSTGLAEQRIRDGAVLGLVPADHGAAPLEDPAEALAAQVAGAVLGWHPRLVRPVALAVLVLLLALGAVALARGAAWSGAVAAAAVVMLGGLAGLALHRRHERLLAAGSGWAAVGFAAVAGSQYAGPVAACIAAAGTAGVLARSLRGIGVLLVPAIAASVLLGCLALLASESGLAPGLVAALGLSGTSMLVPALPRLALLATRDRAGPARELLRAMLAATAVVMVVLAAPAASAGTAGALLATVVGTLAACRASRHHGAVEVIAGLATGVVIASVAAVVTILRHPEQGGIVGMACLVIGGAAAGVALSATDGRGAVTAGVPERDPRLALAIDHLETAALVALVPVLVWVADVVPLVKGMVHR